MRKLFIILLIVMPVFGFAQRNNGSIKGIVYDSAHDYALQDASVTIYKQADSSIVEFRLTNDQGEFDIKNIPQKTPLYYIITYTGYRPAIKAFQLDSTLILDLKKILLVQRNRGELEEVVVKVVQPIRMNGDTLEINPDAFKLDSGAVVEDMLLRVPGLTVWGDGSITMNGRRMDKVLVDGKPFFGGATQTATQNLPKNAIDKIQVYQEKDYTKLQNTDEKADSLYTMNIKLKEDKKKGMFGKVGVGYGTDNRYTGDGVIQAFNKKTQAGFAAGINNINKEEGTGENAFQENTFKSNFRIYYGGRGDVGGITRRTYANLKVQHSFSETDNSQFFRRITGDYGFLNLSKNYISNTTNIQNINNYKQSYISNNKIVSDNISNTAKFQYEDRKQWGNYVSINGSYTRETETSKSSSNTDAFRNDNLAVSRSGNVSESSSTRDNFSMFGFIRSNDWGMNKDPRKNYSINMNAGYGNSDNHNTTVNKFESFIDTIPSNTISRIYDNKYKNYYAGGSFNYDGFRQLLFGIYNFFNINMSLKNEVYLSKNEQNAHTQDFDSVTHSYLENKTLTNVNQQTNWTYTPSLEFSKSFNKYVWEKYYYWLNISFDVRQQFITQKNESSILNRNLERSFNTFAPRASVNFNYQKTDAFRLYSNIWANTNVNLPSIDQLYPIVDNANRYDSVVGNPNLKPVINRYASFNGEISRTRPTKKSSYGANIGFNFNNYKNAISDNRVYDPSGKTTRYLINVQTQNSYSANLGLNFSTKLNKASTINFRYNTSLNHNKRPGFVNGISALSLNDSWSNGLNATYNLIDKFNITLGEAISTNTSTQQNLNSTIKSEIKNYSTNGNINYFITKNITLNTSLNYQNNIAANGNSATASIWNASALYRFMKQQAELKFSAFDLLRQNKNITNFVRENSATTTITNGLQQYFMLTFSYYPRKFGGGGKGGPPPVPSGGIMIVR